MAPNTLNPGHFGKMVIGEEAAKQEAIVVEKGANIFGKLVVDDVEAIVAGEATAAAQEINPQNPKELATALNETPDAFDALLDAEFLRNEGPRKTWLRVFLSVEQQREPPRDAVIERVKRGLSEAAS